MRHTTDRALFVKTLVAFAALYMIWGSTYLAIRVTLDSIPPAVSAGARMLTAGLLMLVLTRLSGQAIVPSRRELLSLGIIGCLLLVAGNGMVVWSEQYVASGLAALLVATVSLWIAILGALLPDGERLPVAGWIGVFLGFVGLGVLLWPKLMASGTNEARGVAALLLATFSWASGSLYSKRAKLSLPPLVAAGWEMLIAGVVLSTIAVSSGELVHCAPTAKGWMALAYLVVFGSCVAFSAFGWLLQHVPAAKVMTYAYVNPVIAVALGCLLRGEPFTASMTLGTPIIVVAVALVTTARIRSAPQGSRAILQREAGASTSSARTVI